jgi:hypothetical protein
MGIFSTLQDFSSFWYKNALGFFQPLSGIAPPISPMAPTPPESALDAAGTAFLTALQDYEGVMDIPGLSMASKHVTLNAAIDRAVRPLPMPDFPVLKLASSMASFRSRRACSTRIVLSSRKDSTDSASWST